ncbi:MAG: SPOR domain-containing protein, partial [Deferribacteraceae bacterium]|nr:SPOR domain-containing protein [Deferribacteraceae bacterium]
MKQVIWLILALSIVGSVIGCSTMLFPDGTIRVMEETAPHTAGTGTADRMQYVIQAGAFKSADNAATLTDELEDSNLEPYYFKDADGLYKVRFGNFATSEAAK